MTTRVGLGRLVWPYGENEFLIEQTGRVVDDTAELHDALAFTHFSERARGHRLVINGLRAGEQAGYSDLETWVNASIPVNWQPTWSPFSPDIDASVAVSLLKRLCVRPAAPDAEAARRDRESAHSAPTPLSLEARLVAADRAQYERLATKLSNAFRVDPLEDGWTHPAEQVIAAALSQARAPKWLHSLCVGPTRSPHASSILVCLGRLDRPGTLVWRVRLIREALAETDVEVRDAAVQAADSWGDRAIGYILRHHEDAVPWLRKYAGDVIAEHGW